MGFLFGFRRKSMALEDETARSYLITQPGEKLAATLRAVDSFGRDHITIYPVILRNPQTATEALIPSEQETLEEIGKYRRVTSYPLEDAELLFNPGISEVDGLKVGSLTIRRIPDHLKSSSWDDIIKAEIDKTKLDKIVCIWPNDNN